MNKLLKFVLVISAFLCIGSFIFRLFFFEKLFLPAIGFIGINSLFLGIAAVHIKRTNASRAFGAYLLFYMLIYIWINFDLYHHWIFRDHLEIQDIFYLNSEYYYFHRFVLRNALIFFLTSYSVYLLIRGGLFSQMQSTKLFKAAMILLGIYVLAEIPMYDLHGDIGGNNHGHSFWYGLHMH